MSKEFLSEDGPKSRKQPTEDQRHHCECEATRPLIGYNLSPKAETIEVAMSEADIDGHGSEGAGYDMEKFAAELEARGWVWNGDEPTQGPGESPPKESFYATAAELFEEQQ